MPEPLQDYLLAATASWEVDIWKKLRNAQKAAQARYLESIEGKNFVKTNLIAEVASSYYELLSLDRELEIVQQNIDIQSNALNIVKLQKEAARATELAVKKFEAEVLKTKSLKYGIQQEIVETENRINYLLGRFPQPIARSATTFDMQLPLAIQAGLPSQLLEYRPDIRKAELELNAAKLDVKVAKARFYPSVALSAGIGFQAFNPAYLTKLPESLLSSLAGDLMAPLVNRNAIKAAYYSAGARQVQAVYDYERTVVNAFAEVVNQMNQIQNLSESIALKKQQVAALTESINISNDLFRSARADYMEVLMTQRDALEAKFELIEARKKQLHTMVNVYKSLGGGWKE
jgi:NodT family efflux transporter outer membrane factor (OMF) lipoprotein